MMEYKIKDENLVTVNPLFTIVDIEVERDSNKNEILTYMYSPDWVKVLGKTKSDRYLMIKQWRPGCGESLEIPGGKVDDGETPLEAGIRELEEETGYKPASGCKIIDLGTHYANPAFLSNKIHYFYLDGIEETGETNYDDFEKIYPCLYNKDQLINIIEENKIQSICSLLGLLKAFK